MKSITYNNHMTKNDFFSQGYTGQKIRSAPPQPCNLGDNIQAKQKQYGLKHRVMSKIHAALGDKLEKMATEISQVTQATKCGIRDKWLSYSAEKIMLGTQYLLVIKKTQFNNWQIYSPFGRNGQIT